MYGELTDQNGKKYTVTELDKMQQDALKEHLKSWDEKESVFEDSVTVYRIGADHKLIGVEEGCLKAYTDHLECGGERLDYAGMDGMAIYSRSVLLIHHESVEGHLEIKSDISFSALKYLYLYNFTKEA